MKYKKSKNSNRHRTWKHNLSDAGHATYYTPDMWPWDSLTAADVSPFKYHLPRDPDWKVHLPLQWLHNRFFSCDVRQREHFIMVLTMLWAILLPMMVGIVVLAYKSFLVGFAILYCSTYIWVVLAKLYWWLGTDRL